MSCAISLILVGAIAYGSFRLGQEVERRRPLVRSRHKAASRR